MADKMKLIVEISEDCGFKMMKPHRQYHGPRFKGQILLDTELDFGEFEDIHASICDEGEETPGRSTKVGTFEDLPGKVLVITSDPALYGTPDERRAAGKMIFNKMDFGAWNLLGEVG